MVRLMHSMVRANVLRRPADWDQRVYGIPIPQVDQMPAGLIPIFLLAEKVLGEGRTSFTQEERARVELARYRCFLLGLPEELLADTPQGIADRRLVAKLEAQLASYGHAHFTTDAAKYRAKPAAPDLAAGHG